MYQAVATRNDATTRDFWPIVPQLNQTSPVRMFDSIQHKDHTFGGCAIPSWGAS
jgi:hypothetical protein